MFCSKCGASIPDGSQSCPNCGAPTASAPRSSAPPPAAAAPATGWQQPPQQTYYMGPQQTDGKAVGSLICGILALFPLGMFAGIPAVILGHVSKSSIAKSMGRLKGSGMATAGLVMGYLSIAVIPVILIIAAIAIPNLLRAKMAANEAAAASTVRTIVTSQVTYSTDYFDYAPSLSALGPGQARCSSPSDASAEHACLLDAVVGCPETWCTRSGYKFNSTVQCDGTTCNFVVTATPVNLNASGVKSFCATTDQIVRVQQAGIVAHPLTVDECKAWPPIL